MPHKADTTVICQCGGPTNLLTNPHITTTTTTFVPHKADPTVICQCGAISSKCYIISNYHMQKQCGAMISQ